MVFLFIAVEHLGERPLAVTNIIRSVSGIVFVIVSSFASTASTLVSNQMGRTAGAGRRHDAADRGHVLPDRHSAVGPVRGFPELILRIYTDEQSLIDGVGRLAAGHALVLLISVPAFIRFNVVSGTGNTRSALMLELATLSVYAIYTVWIVLYRHSDVALCWTTEHVYALVLLLLASLYLKRPVGKTGKYKTIKRGGTARRHSPAQNAKNCLMEELTLTTPSILFSAISLIMLAYTNRFLAYASVIRNLKKEHESNPSPITQQQMDNLRRRLHMTRSMQIYGVSSLLLCVVCTLLIYIGLQKKRPSIRSARRWVCWSSRCGSRSANC